MPDINNKELLEQQTADQTIATQMPVGTIVNEGTTSRQEIASGEMNSTAQPVTTSIPSPEIVETIRELTKTNRRIAAKRTAQSRISRPQHIPNRAAPQKKAASTTRGPQKKRGRPATRTAMNRYEAPVARTAQDLPIDIPMPQEERKQITIPTSITTPVLLIVLLGIIFVAHRSIQGLRNKATNTSTRPAAVLNIEEGTATSGAEAAQPEAAAQPVQAEKTEPGEVAAADQPETAPTANTTPVLPAPTPKPTDVPILAVKTLPPTTAAKAEEAAPAKTEIAAEATAPSEPAAKTDDAPAVKALTQPTEAVAVAAAPTTTTAEEAAPAVKAEAPAAPAMAEKAAEPAKEGWTTKQLNEEEFLKVANLTKVEIPNGYINVQVPAKYIYIPQQGSAAVFNVPVKANAEISGKQAPVETPARTADAPRRTWHNWTDPYTNSGPLDLDGEASRQMYLSTMKASSAPAKHSAKKTDTNTAEKTTEKATSSATSTASSAPTSPDYPIDLALENTPSSYRYRGNTSDYSNPWNSGGPLDLDGPHARSIYQKQLTSRK